MAYEYEESNKQIVFTVDNESSMGELNERIKELEEVYRKAKAWEELKESFIRVYVMQNNIKESNNDIKVKHQTYRNILRKMDELDNTNEFSNLLNDLEDE
ncbi:hypothetical protein AABD37_02300 [Staphylococcus nepalensis]